MKYTTLLIVLIFSFLLILPASAADINEDVVSADEIAANETISENEETDVELNTNETYGTYGNIENTPEGEKNYKKWMEKNDLRENEYYLAVGRFVPENNYETMIREFMEL